VDGSKNPDTPISHIDAATLYFTLTTIGSTNYIDWQKHLHEWYLTININFCLAFQLLQLAFLMEPNKTRFSQIYSAIWKVTIWNSYRNTLFHDSNNTSSLIYSTSYNLVNQISPTDPYYPLLNSFTNGKVPLLDYDYV
jgi:hypothetical protein